MENNSPVLPVTLDGDDGSDSIYNYRGGHKALILGGKGNDTLQNACKSVTLLGGNGNDYLSKDGTDKVSINGGSGNDTIYNVKDINIQLSTNSMLIGGAGNDSIYNTGSNSTIEGGTGNDPFRSVPLLPADALHAMKLAAKTS